MKKMALTNINGVEEVNIFKDDGSVIHITGPKSETSFCCLSLCDCFHFPFLPVQASIPSNTYVVSGVAENKRLEELLPNILSQLGQESMDYLRQYAESMGDFSRAQGGASDTINEGNEEEEDDEVPDLVENFEEAAAK